MTPLISNIINLWKSYNMAANLLKDAMGGTSNEIGEFAEKLVAHYCNGKQLPASSKSADIALDDGKKIQVKARRLSGKTTTTSLGVIRSWDFDFLVVVLFSRNGSVLLAVQVDVETAQSYARPNKLQNGWVITTTNDFLSHKKTVDITEELNAVLGMSFAPKKNSPSGKSNPPPVSPPPYAGTLPVEFIPANQHEFKRLLLLEHLAYFHVHYSNGLVEDKVWDARRIQESSNIIGNIRSRPEFRRNAWQQSGIVKVVCEIPVDVIKRNKGVRDIYVLHENMAWEK